MHKILVIEDDPDMTFILTRAFSNKYEVEIINNTDHLLDIVVEFLPDLILTDNSIGHIKACEIIKEIRCLEQYKTIPVILFSGHPDIKKLSCEMNAIAYLPKPFTLKDLYACIDEVLLNIFEEETLLQ